MGGGIEDAALYEEQQMEESIAAGKTVGRLTEVADDRGGYAPLVNTKPYSEATLPKKVLDGMLKETGLDEHHDKIAIDFDKWVESEPHQLQKVFDEVINQVSKGKGEERHGNGKDFLNQPWKDLCDTYGVGFAFGQAAKKLSESQGMTGEARKREQLGAIAYLAIGVLYEDIKR